MVKPPNQRSRGAFRLLIAVAAIMWLASAPFLKSQGPNLPAVFLFGSTMFYCCAAGAWLGLGYRRWRWLFVIVTPIMLGIGVNLAIAGHNEDIFIAMTCCTTVFAALTTFLLRFAKGNFKQVAPDDHTTDALQFGIRDLMIWTAVIAVLTAIMKAVFGADFRFHSQEAVVVAITSLSFSLITVIDIWAIHGKRVTPTKMLVVVVMTCCAVSANYFALDRYRWFFPAVLLLCQALAVTMMLSLRSQGYRFVKRTIGQTTTGRAVTSTQGP